MSKPDLELIALHGQSGIYEVMIGKQDKLYVPVVITNARRAFGRIDVLVTPEGGEGEVWTKRTSITLRAVKGKGGRKA